MNKEMKKKKALGRTLWFQNAGMAVQCKPLTRALCLRKRNAVSHKKNKGTNT